MRKYLNVIFNRSSHISAFLLGLGLAVGNITMGIVALIGAIVFDFLAVKNRRN